MTRNLIALGCGLLGTAAALVGWHLWDDHRLIDAIRAAQQAQLARQIEQLQQQQTAP